MIEHDNELKAEKKARLRIYIKDLKRRLLLKVVHLDDHALVGLAQDLLKTEDSHE